ncbi:MAG: CRISPR-associated endonuclease Cas2 [Candidatus Giovannonibacteria bacterium]|nr:MAG: CRISPR-associated endonuclease Cas2 [Candidatus Giovannonibacteria bacterium]
MRKRYSELRIGPTAQKVVLLLWGGLALGLTHSPRQYFKIIKMIGKEWHNINRRALYNAIKSLYRSRLIDAEDNASGVTTLVLTERGKKKALTYQIDELKIPPMKKWDRKWRIVLFDIPESMKKARDALARTLKNAGFIKFQKSVFIHPFECRNEVDFIIEFFNVRPHVRFITATEIDNELHLKNKFNL